MRMAEEGRWHLVRVGGRELPSYTPDIEHLVFPRGQPQQTTTSSKVKAARSRLAGVLALTRSVARHNRNNTKGSRGGSGTPETQQSKKTITQNLTQFSRASVQQPALPNIRGNVSVLQLRSTSEPWETKSSVYSGGRETHQISHQTSRESNPSSRERGLRREGLSVEEDCSRELSPVRWCDQEVDGVYLGRSGWVQVQQRSLDENRASANGYQHVKHGNHVTRIKMADYHCSRSEPGKLPPERPGYLPLRREATPRSLDLGAIEPSSPPPATPIISPPPAFQDVSHRPRPYLRHQPALSRSDAIEISPPESPTYRYQPPRPSPAYAQPSRVKKKTPSPVHTPHHFVPQTKSLEDTIASRRAIYQKHDSSSSSSGSFGFRSLDTGSTLPMPLRGMPRLSETDSSLCGYDEDEDRNFLAVADARVSPRGRAMQRTNRRSPASPQPPARSPSSSSSSSCSRSPTFRRQQPRQDANRVSSRVRRSRSLQLPERKSPQQISPQDTRQPSPNYVEKPLTKNIMVEPQSRLSKDHSRQSSLQSNPEPTTRGTRILEQLTRQAKLIEQINRQSRNNSLEQQTLPNRTKSHNSDPRKRHPPSHSRSMGSNDYDLEAELRREAEVEARLVADYLGSARSREAARELLRHRYLDLREEPGSGMRPQSSDYNVVLVGTGRRLARGASSPCQPNPCNPTTCDFWPHCAHRDVYPQQHPHAQPSGLKPSQSYPTQHAQPRKEAVPRSSPASLERNRKRSPVISVESPGGSSSSSSDVWVGAGSLRGSPRPESRSRPGSAPTEQQSVVRPQAQQRSLSLPKWFQPTRDQHQTLPSSHRPPRPSMQQTSGSGWSRSAGGRPPPRSMVAGSTLRPPTPEISRTAPTTPVREMKTQEKQQIEVLSQQSSRFSSTPALEPTSNTEWYIKDWVTYSDDKENLLVNKEIPVSHKNIPGESVLQKFRKSFSLKFHKKGQIKDCDEEETSGGAVSLADSPPSSPHARSHNHLDQDKEKFRFGPLVWRSSKERKKGKKAARSAKCNSGDSGIQIEMSSKIPGDSSESHDTDHLGDEETLDDLDSPPVVRRRGTGSSSEGKPSRPTSDVINQVLIDKLKADLQACRGLRRANVRRTHSDLGGQRLYNWDPRRSYRRLYSSPSPIKSRVMSSATTNDPARTNLTEAQIRHLKRMRGRPTRLRRSVSQPLGINELSPLVRRKPSSGIRQNVFSEDERGGATTDDEMHSDSESSVTSLTERKKSFEMAMDEDVVILAEAVWDHVAMEKEELGFRAGDVIEVLDTLDKDWWWGTCNNSYGWFPSPFVRLRVSQQETVEDCLAAVAEGRPKSLRRRQSVSLLSNDQVRSKVVTELLNTERDFVKILRDVTEGYLVECRKRKDMFSEEQIQSIFSNLEDLLAFQDKFLQDLETRVDWEAPHRSCVAQSFINYKSGFRMYSEYCNSQPMAIATLQELYQHVSFSKFFEACRLMRGLIEIPLDGYLLTPVQRICKYPLQLAELLKYTKTEHADHEKLVEAHEAMRDVAVLINERKRRMESLEKLAAWQLRLDGWEGEDLIESSSQLIHQGDAIRVTTGMWTNNITLFLFDHQLIYCKKDILKRNTYVYKGRMSMDTSEVINLSDGKEPVLGVTVRHGIKVYSCVRDKWLVFCLRTAEEKATWLEALARERCLVEDDMREGIEFAPADRQLAKLAAIRHSTYTPPIPGKSYKLSESAMRSRSLQRGSTLQQQPQPESTQSLGRRVGTWFNFGGNKKWRSGSSGSAIRSATLHAVHPT